MVFNICFLQVFFVLFKILHLVLVKGAFVCVSTKHSTAYQCIIRVCFSERNDNFLVHWFQFTGSRGGVSKLDWGTRMRIALEAAKGLEYLHEHVSPPVIHRDFKSSNILLDKNFHAKVSDFGLAKLGSEKAGGHVSTRVLGTQGYVAPE